MTGATLKNLKQTKVELPRWCYGVLLLIGLSVFFLYGVCKEQLFERPYQNRINSALAENSKSQIDLFNQLIEGLIRAVDETANSPEALVALKSPQPERSKWTNTARVLDVSSPTRTWELKAKTQIPGAQALHLLAADAPFPIDGNFVALRLFEQAARVQSPAPRAAKLQTWSILIARPVVSEGNIEGVLLAEIDPDSLAKKLEANSEIQGRIQLLQEVDRFAPVAIFKAGGGGLSSHSIQVPTVISHWKLEFIGSPTLLADIEPSGLLFYGVYALICVVALLAAAILIRKTVILSKPVVERRQRVNPMDDLFTEKYQRKPQATQTLANLARQQPRAAATDEAATDAPEVDSRDEIVALPRQVFREYDIRGKAYTEITGDFAFLLGRVLAVQHRLRGDEKPIAVCCDGRLSSPVLKQALISGISTAGCNVLDLGSATTPVMNFALATLDQCNSGVMVTASHNPKDDNGFKIIIDNQAVSSEHITGLYSAMTEAAKAEAEDIAPGRVEELDITDHYISHLADDVLPSDFKLAIDCSNGIAGAFAPQLFRRIGCEVHGLFTDVDGNFPNHTPDPTVPGNLKDLIDLVKTERLDLGLAFDGDGDRVVAVTASGRIVWPDELLMIFARDIVTRAPGSDVVFDVKSTRRLREVISSYGGRPIMWKTGHANIRRKVREINAPIGGEFSGHIFFNDRWFGFDDGLYGGARLLEILTLREQSLDEVISGFPEVACTPEIKIPVAEEEKERIIADLQEQAVFGDAHVNKLDGLRVEYPDGWGLLRSSNTSANLTLRFEAENPEALQSIINAFKQQIEIFYPELPLDF